MVEDNLNWHSARNELPDISGDYIVLTYAHVLMVAKFHSTARWDVSIPKSVDKVDVSTDVFLWAEIPLLFK